MRKSKAITELTETVAAMTDSAMAAGLDIPSMPEPVSDNTPAVIDLEPKTITLEQRFDWNFDEIKASLASKIERYAGLVVTDDNLKDMEKTQRDIASLRVKISKFQLQVKRDMEKPFGRFKKQIDELQKLVESVEKPIKDQLEVYETKRRAEKSAMVQAMIDELALQVGLEEKYASQIVIADNYLNRGTTKKEITEDLQMKIAWFLDIQAKEHQAELFKAQKAEMAKLLCQSLSTGLATPISYEEIQERIEALNDILAVKTLIEHEVARRKELETKAAQAAAEMMAPPMPPKPPAGDPPLPPYAPSWGPPMAPPAVSESLWDADLHIYATTVAKMERLKAFMAAENIQYAFSNHMRRD